MGRDQNGQIQRRLGELRHKLLNTTRHVVDASGRQDGPVVAIDKRGRRGGRHDRVEGRAAVPSQVGGVENFGRTEVVEGPAPLREELVCVEVHKSDRIVRIERLNRGTPRSNVFPERLAALGHKSVREESSLVEVAGHGADAQVEGGNDEDAVEGQIVGGERT